MKTYDENSEQTREEKLKAENELLKKKLTDEFGMMSSGSELPEDLENQWLNYIYDFETMYKNAERVTVYELIGKPEFKKIHYLSEEEIHSELKRLLSLIESSKISVYFCCDYDDRTVYKFITEELFREIIEDIQIPGMKFCLNYEEFHPNHEYDIRYLAEKFFEFFLRQKWDTVHSEYQLADTMLYKSSKMKREDFVKILHSFRDSIKPVKPESIQIGSVEFNIENKSGSAKGDISYLAEESVKKYSGQFKLGVTFNDFYWVINEIKFPGFD